MRTDASQDTGPHTRNTTSDNEHADVHSSAIESATDDKNDGADHHRPFSADLLAAPDVEDTSEDGAAGVDSIQSRDDVCSVAIARFASGSKVEVSVEVRLADS